MNILMVLTSHDQLGNTGRKTGFWLEEFAAPYFTFLDAGATVTVASPKGGQPPLDPVSDTPEGQTELTRRFKLDSAAQAVLANTLTLSDIKPSDYDAVFYPGGHGPCGIWPRIRIQSPLLRRFTTLANQSPLSATRPVCSIASSSRANRL